RADGRHPLEIYRHAHRDVAEPVRVQVVARAAGRGVGHALGLHRARGRIGDHLVEVGDAVEDTAGADELVERLSLRVLLWEAVIGVVGADRRRESRADHAHTGNPGPETPDGLLHPGLDGLGCGLAVFAEVVDAREPDAVRAA